MKNLFLAFSVLSASAAFALGPTISGVTWSQPSGAGKVTIEYTVSESAVVTVDVLTNGVSLGAANLTGFVEEGVPAESGSAFNRVVAAGAHTVTWKPYKSLPQMAFRNGEVDVKLTAYSLKAPPLYLLADLTSPSNVHYYASVEDLPFGSLVTNAPYRSTHLLMRRIDAAGVKWRMGAASLEMPETVQAPGYRNHETPHFVTLTNDYYIGVFEVTQSQHQNVTGTNPSEFKDPTTYPEHDFMPVEKVSLDGLTGTGAWRSSGSPVGGSSALQKWRKLTSLTLDLPTEARWEYACRAGSTNSYNNFSESGLGTLAWYGVGADKGGHTHPVGEKQPNAWGLYDMHGNVFEMTTCHWQANVSSNPVLDPESSCAGNMTETSKGGSFNYGTSAASAAAGRTDSTGNYRGYRLWAPLPTAIP